MTPSALAPSLCLPVELTLTRVVLWRLRSQEDVLATVAVVRHEVASGRREHHVAPVARDRRPTARVIGLRALGGHAHSPRPDGLQITQEHLALAVGVARHEVLRGGGE